MNKIFFLILIIINFKSFSQKELTSFYFKEAQPSVLKSVSKFDSTICGKYVLEEDSLTQLVITEDSIYMLQNVLFIITKKDFRKSKGKYYVENEKVYGIVDNKGIPFIKQNDTTFAIYKQTNNYFTPSKSATLKKQNKTYFLNEKQDNNYYTSSILFSFGKGIAIYSLDHEEVMDEVYKFDQLDSIQLDGFKTYIANPSLLEMNNFIQKKGFNDPVVFFEPKYYIEKD